MGSSWARVELIGDGRRSEYSYGEDKHLVFEYVPHNRNAQSDGAFEVFRESRKGNMMHASGCELETRGEEEGHFVWSKKGMRVATKWNMVSGMGQRWKRSWGFWVEVGVI